MGFLFCWKQRRERERETEKGGGGKLVSDDSMIISLERDFLPVEEHLRSNRATPLVVVSSRRNDY